MPIAYNIPLQGNGPVGSNLADLISPEHFAGLRKSKQQEEFAAQQMLQEQQAMQMRAQQMDQAAQMAPLERQQLTLANLARQHGLDVATQQEQRLGQLRDLLGAQPQEGPQLPWGAERDAAQMFGRMAAIEPQFANEKANAAIAAQKSENMYRAGVTPGAGQMGTTPIYGVDANGNTVILQTRASGGLMQSPLPDGVVLTPNLQWRDMGGQVVGVDPRTGKTVSSSAKTLPPEKQPENVAAMERTKVVAESAAKKEVNSQGVDGVIKQARALLSGSPIDNGKGGQEAAPAPTGSGMGAARDALAKQFGISLPSSQTAARLEVLGGILVGKVPRFEGPQSDADRKYYMEMAGKIGDRKTPGKERLEALKEVEKMFAKTEQNQPGAAGSGFSVTLPDGRTKTFPSAAAAAAFKKAAGL